MSRRRRAWPQLLLFPPPVLLSYRVPAVLRRGFDVMGLRPRPARGRGAEGGAGVEGVIPLRSNGSAARLVGAQIRAVGAPATDRFGVRTRGAMSLTSGALRIRNEAHRIYSRSAGSGRRWWGSRW
uniref:Uncharacterized protein n=1 Tax=Setaria viridis TaxID=4556 RepID=A0A4U6TBS1_SETVI|nr:hypothetical protein SEVIR_8G049300v2 [Setaria viridis]